MTAARLFLSFGGVALAVAAIATNDRRIAWAAIVVLAMAVLMRVRARRQARRDDEGEG